MLSDDNVLILSVVATVLQNDKHVLDGTTLKVTACDNTCGMPDKEEAQQSRVIEVHGLAATSTKDSILMFFENTRRTGGGEVEHVDYTPEKGIAVVTFVKAESELAYYKKRGLCYGSGHTRTAMIKLSQFHCL